VIPPPALILTGRNTGRWRSLSVKINVDSDSTTRIDSDGQKYRLLAFPCPSKSMKVMHLHRFRMRKPILLGLSQETNYLENTSPRPSGDFLGAVFLDFRGSVLRFSSRILFSGILNGNRKCELT